MRRALSPTRPPPGHERQVSRGTRTSRLPSPTAPTAPTLGRVLRLWLRRRMGTTRLAPRPRERSNLPRAIAHSHQSHRLPRPSNPAILAIPSLERPLATTCVPDTPPVTLILHSSLRSLSASTPILERPHPIIIDPIDELVRLLPGIIVTRHAPRACSRAMRPDDGAATGDSRRANRARVSLISGRVWQ